MDEAGKQISSLSTEMGSAEERMLEAESVREMVARKERGEGVKRISRELGVDRKTVKRWLKLGSWQPRQVQRRVRQLDRFTEFLERRAAEWVITAPCCTANCKVWVSPAAMCRCSVIYGRNG